MKPLNPKHIREIIRLINHSPFFSLLSLDVKALEYGYCRVEIALEEKHLNPFGGLHGGVYSAAIDTAAYWAVYCAAPEEMGLISLDLHVDNLSTVQSGKLIVEGKQVKAGRSVCLAEATVKDCCGKLLACGSSKQVLVPGLQTIPQAIAAMGMPPLPPKFLSQEDSL